jgi:hypothetical protein
MEQTPRRRHELPGPSPFGTTRPALDKTADELWTSKADSLLAFACLTGLRAALPAYALAAMATTGLARKLPVTPNFHRTPGVCALLCQEFGASPVARAVSLPCHGPVVFGPAWSSLSVFSFLGRRQR